MTIRTKTEHSWARLLAYITGLGIRSCCFTTSTLPLRTEAYARLPACVRLPSPERATVAEIGKRVGRKVLAWVVRALIRDPLPFVKGRVSEVEFIQEIKKRLWHLSFRTVDGIQPDLVGRTGGNCYLIKAKTITGELDLNRAVRKMKRFQKAAGASVNRVYPRQQQR